MTTAAGLRLYRASRTELLAHALIAELDAQPPPDVLGVQRVVVAHAGLGRWLLQILAIRHDPRGPGIAANLRFELPGQWLARCMRELLGDSAIEAGPFRQEALRWRILEALPGLANPAVAHYLQQPRAAAGFELANHLASLYTQYLVYRRDWLAAVESGREPADPGSAAPALWQAGLWRQLQRAIGRPHRGHYLEQLLHGLERGRLRPADRQPLHLFGLNHLAPDSWRLVRALSQYLPVHFYLVDPVQAYWEDVRHPGAELRASLKDATVISESAHALVAALGAVGRLCNRQLSNCEPLHDYALEAPEMVARDRLQRLQLSVRRLLPSLAGAPLQTKAHWLGARKDRSLRIHACHSRLRELEALRDALLDLLDAHPELHPRDIVVMAPDIGAYAELIPAVFGAGGANPSPAQRRLPCQLADRALVSLHPLLASFGQWLELDRSRLGASSVLALLKIPAVMRRLRLSPGEIDTLEAWFEHSRVAWGLDAAMRTEFGGAAEPAQTWAWARDRWMLGYLLGADPQFQEFDGILAQPGVVEPETRLLGTLTGFLDVLAEQRAQMRQPRGLVAWSQWLEQAIEQLFMADPQDARESAALAAMAATAANLAEQAELAGVDPPLTWDVVRALVHEQLNQTPPRQQFLGGGISFCGMVPARVIPFDVVALLGLNETEFPRSGLPSALNLVEQAPRAGDRSTRDEDLYLFLEALMSARLALHLSYIGHDAIKGKPCNPAAPLKELLEFLAREHGLDPDNPQTRPAPWLVEHALQPFAPQYFVHPPEDPCRFSYQRHFALALPDTGSQRLPPFNPALPESAAVPPVLTQLGELRRFLRDPARFSLQRGLRLSLEVLDERMSADAESLEPRFAALDVVPQRLFEYARGRGEVELGATIPAWLSGSGLLPPGAAGELAYAAAREQVNLALRALSSRCPQLFGQRRRPLGLEFTYLDAAGQPRQLKGRVVPFQGDDGLVLLDVRIGKPPQARQLLSLFCDYAALRLAQPQARVLALQLSSGGQKAEFAACTEDWARRDLALLGAQLGMLHEHAQHARIRPLWWFPYTSWTFASAPEAERDYRARNAWRGVRDHPGEQHYSPPYAARLSRGRDFLDLDEPAHHEFVTLAHSLYQLVHGAGG